MASSADVEAEVTENNILYDLTIHAEWKQDNELFSRTVNREKNNAPILGRLTSSTQRAAWTFLRTLGLPIQKASPCSLPVGLVKLVGCQTNWHIAVSSEAKYVGILQEQHIEIRSDRDDYSTVVGRANIQRDAYPQWRHLAWSPDCSMLACSYSSGTVEVYDIVGTLLFTINGWQVESTNNKLPVDLSGAVAALIFMDKKIEEWSAEMLVANYHGSLTSYKVDRDKGFSLQHSFLFNQHYPRGISSIICHQGAGLLYVGGCGLDRETDSIAMEEGLTAWRILSDYPHYKLVTSLSDDQKKVQRQRSLVSRIRIPNLSYLKGNNPDGIFKLSLSPNGKFLAAIHHSGKCSIWSSISLKLQNSWEHSQQEGSDEINPEYTENPQLRKQLKDLVLSKNLVDVNWWSDEAVILARGSGAVTVSSMKTLTNLLGQSPEWFEPSPRLNSVHNGGFLGLEVETRFPSKRRLVALDPEGQEEEDSDEDEGGLVAKTTHLTKQMLHAVTDLERFQPKRKKQKLVNRKYRLVSLKRTTPPELFQRRIDHEEYGEALALARTYGLDCDLVYQRQWRKSPVSIAAIQDYLGKINKRSWVLHECMERISDGIDAMKALLEFGLKGTNVECLIQIGKGEDEGRFILCDPEEGLYEDMDLDEYDPEADTKRKEVLRKHQEQQLSEVDFNNLTLEQRELCRCRYKLQQYLYRLKTYECILGGQVYAAERYDIKTFEKFRSQNMVETAVKYAQCSDWKALEILFSFHSKELAQHRLAILSNFPETTSVTEYGSLLPQISEESCVLDWEEDEWREADWVEQEPCVSKIDVLQSELGEFLYEEQPTLSSYKSPLTPGLLSTWYKQRAIEIEGYSRQVDFAVEFIRLGIESQVPDLEQMRDDLVTMAMLVYDCQVDDALTFIDLQKMSDYDKLKLIMAKSTDEMYSKHLRTWMVPFLRQCERRLAGTYDSLLRDYLVTMAKADLTRPLKIFEASKPNSSAPVITTHSLLMSVAMECLYSCERDDQLRLAREILKCLPQKSFGKQTPEIKKLHLDVDVLENHLEAARILEENGIRKPMYFIRDTETSADNTQELMIKLTRMASHKDPPLSEIQWNKLHSDIMELQDKVYTYISKKLCHEIFVESLLCSSKLVNIQLAGKLVEHSEEESHSPSPRQFNMQTRVQYDRAVELVVSAAREYFNSSANLTDPCIAMARSCLNLIQDSPHLIQEESDLISSLSVLEDFGVTILPLQVRLCKDRLELIQKAVGNNPIAYKNTQKFLRLGHLLRINAEDRQERDGKVLHIVASAAIKMQDFACAFDLCDQLMQWGHAPAWDVCVDLAEQENFQNVQAKVQLLSFAVTFCTPDMIEPVLQARSLLETQVLFEKISRDVEGSKGDGKRISPFSAKAALQQTQQILTSTKQTTKSVLSTVTNAKWWNSTVSRMKQPSQQQVQEQVSDRNKHMEKQAYHPFYDGIIDNAYCNVVEADLMSGRQEEIDIDLEMRESLLRTAQLEAILTEGENSEPATEVLIQLASHSFPVDNALSLAYLLALKQPSDADRCFTDHPRTDISLQLAIYYYALQIFSSVKPITTPGLSTLYTHPPTKVMERVMTFVTEKADSDWPEDVQALIGKMKHYTEMLQDYRQARVLRGLGRGIDIGRFTEDIEYKQETILGLAMNVEDSLYNISVSLAERYNIPRWEVYAAHLEFLFCDSGMSCREMEARVTKLDILPTLRSQPEKFCDRLSTYVYPTLEGADLDRLHYYYLLLSGYDKPLQGGLTAAQHVKLLKKLKSAVKGLDYRQLMSGEGQVMDILSPCLTAENINTVTKIANLIPDRSGGFLQASSICCMWATKFFWEGGGKKQSETSIAWVHRYEACQEYVLKLLTDDIVTLVQSIIFTPKSRQLLGTESRIEITQRVLKYCRQSGGKKKKLQEGKVGSITWEQTGSILQGYIKHLETLAHPVLITMSQSDADNIKRYVQLYDLTMGDRNTVHELYTSMVLDSELLFEMVQELISVIPSEKWTLTTFVKHALNGLLLKLRNDPDIPEYIKQVNTLQSLEHVVEQVQELTESGPTSVKAEDILTQLRPFCSDSTVEVQPRLDVLYILEKSFRLSEEDSLLLLLYRTQAVVKATWQLTQISEKDVKTAPARQTLYSQLLGQSSTREHFSALCRLLQLWPPFSTVNTRSTDDNAYVQVFTAMIDTHNDDVMSDVIIVVQDMPASSRLSEKCCETVFHRMVAAGGNILGVKLCLITAHKKLFSKAMDTLAVQPKVEEDKVLFDLILKHKLVSSLVKSEHYPPFIEYLLANRDPEEASHDHLNVEDLANQLQESGFEAEAGSLLLQARNSHPVLQTFGAALGVLGRWLKH